MRLQPDDSACPACGTHDYTASYCGLCTPCAARVVREHPDRQLIIDGNAIRYVIPGEPPARRTPQPRDPDDVTDRHEYAEHHGLADPELTFYWRHALEHIHAEEPDPFEDENGHLFGPIERLPVYIASAKDVATARWPADRSTRRTFASSRWSRRP